jgi:hypothetical protein
MSQIVPAPTNASITEEKLVFQIVRATMLSIVTKKNATLFFLVLLCVAISCLSLVIISDRIPTFDIIYDPAYLLTAISGVAALAFLTAAIFVMAEFSFGYFVGFYLYIAVIGFVWLSYFSLFPYDHAIARISSVASIIAFLTPALFLKLNIDNRYFVPVASFEKIVRAAFLFSVMILAVAASYGIKLSSIQQASGLRNTIVQPKAVEYSVGIATGALVPFVFACYWFRREWLQAVAALALLASFYAVTLSKLVLLVPLLMVVFGLFSQILAARVITILSLIVPALVGIAAFGIFGEHAITLFGLFNLRLLGIPSSALDHYNDFFASHPVTHFCQISFIKNIFGCVYEEPLSVLMSKEYHLGNYNASLLATEGVASMGVYLAPIATFFCGVVVAIGNSLSARLPPHFVIVSSAGLVLLLLNVPLSTALLTYGGAVLFALWYLTPPEYLSGTEAVPLAAGD